MLAAEYYIRATILDSPRSAYLLWQLIREKNFYITLNDGISFNNPTAQFVWYGLHKLGYDNRLTEKDALNLLEKSAAQNHLPAIIELGYNYYSGKYIAQDKNTGIQLWNNASKLSSIEANVRLAVSKVFDQKSSDNFSEEIKILQDAESKGSLLAQFALGYCYENGIGLNKSIQEAVKYYKRVCDTKTAKFQRQAHQALGEMLFAAPEPTLTEEEQKQPTLKLDMMIGRVEQLLEAHQHLKIASKLSSKPSQEEPAILNRYVKACLGKKLAELAEEFTKESKADFAVEKRVNNFL